jgi:hypothetical protein
MTENKAVTEPGGFDYAPTERIPVQGDLPHGRTSDDRLTAEPEEEYPVTEDDHVVTEDADVATESTEPFDAVESEPVATEPEIAATEPEPVATAPGTAVAEPRDDVEVFAEEAVHRFRERWRELQVGFVDDPGQAVRGADELVDEIMRELAEHKQRLQEHLHGPGDTEELRVVIREYRAFFNRLLNA